MQPHITLNWWAILTAIVVAFFFGFAWYGPIFGKTWAKMMGMNCEQKPDMAVMRKALVIQIVGLFLITFCLDHTLQVWHPSVWGVGPDGGADWQFGFMGGFFTWLGFFVPLQLNKV